MNTNPFESPVAITQVDDLGETSPQLVAARRTAVFSVRAAILILLVAGLFNYYAFDQVVVTDVVAPRFQTTVRVTNLTGMVAITLVAWFLFVPALEVLGRMLRHLSGEKTPVAAWNESLYRSLRLAVYFAIPGAILWGIWVIGFYFVHLNFMVLSIAVGVPAHLLAAGLYLPLLFRWYLLARSKSEP
ncbi:hypothetical protein DTL42_19720 [Bremerella cremea]|uniref:Uncharacterized protein n=1 Tax=Bremerella cremea TaxID=1031537 RepID=A0A368KQ45_9BACT|nr:hypothetical protein [Bremerella cremea]RCS42060.1 hypothetical protein DTL42_19720 [Bremerella cremea]